MVTPLSAKATQLVRRVTPSDGQKSFAGECWDSSAWQRDTSKAWSLQAMNTFEVVDVVRVEGLLEVAVLRLRRLRLERLDQLIAFGQVVALGALPSDA